MAMNIVTAAVVLLIAFASNVEAFSNGAGSCGAGDTSIRNTIAGNVHGASANGPLADVGVTFSVDGTALTAGSATTFPVGTDLQWSVDAAQTAYKGIFVRVEATGDFTLVGDPTFVDTALTCASISGVLGVDHFNSNAKTSVTGTTNFNGAGTATVDVVVVFSLAQWAHSTFSLTLEQVAAPTEAPVPAPTEAPVPAPTESPVAAPTESPVAAPVETPVATPTDVPVAAPTETPVAAPVDIPVDAPVEPPVEVPTETAEPTPVPVVIPVDVPVEAPVDIIPTTKAPANKPPKAGKVMDMKMGGKNKKGMDTKIVDGKEGKKDKKGMKKEKRRNLRY